MIHVYVIHAIGLDNQGASFSWRKIVSVSYKYSTLKVLYKKLYQGRKLPRSAPLMETIIVSWEFAFFVLTYSHEYKVESHEEERIKISKQFLSNLSFPL